MRLNESEKELARWLSEAVLAGHLTDDLIVLIVADGNIILGYKGESPIPPFSMGMLDMLASEQMLAKIGGCSKPGQGKYRVRPLLHEAVKNNFFEAGDVIEWALSEVAQLAEVIARRFDKENLLELADSMGYDKDELVWETKTQLAHAMLVKAAGHGELFHLLRTVSAANAGLKNHLRSLLVGD